MMRFKILGELVVNLSNLAFNALDKQMRDSEEKKRDYRLKAFKPHLDTMMFYIIKRKSPVIKAIEPQVMQDILPYNGRSFKLENGVGLAYYKIEKANETSNINLEFLKELLNNAILQYAKENNFSAVKWIKACSGQTYKTYVGIVIEYQMN